GIDIVDDHVDVPIIGEVAKRRTPACDDVSQTASRGGWNFLEFGAIEIAEKLRPLRPGGAPILQVHLRIDVSIDDENVEQAVVVEVEEAGSPGQKRDSSVAQPGLIGHIGKISAPVILIESLVIVGKSCGEKIDFAVAVVISDADSHGRLLASIFAERESRSITHIFKRAVMPVAIQEVRRGIVGHQQVHPAVVIDIHKGSGQTVVAVGIRDARLHADVGKGAIAVVVEQVVALSRQAAGPAHHIDPTKLAEIRRYGSLSRDRWMIGIELHVSRNKQIELPVVVVVTPGRARGPASERDAVLLRYVGKCSVVVVVIEPVAAIVSHVDVGPSVIVVIAHRRAESPTLVADAGLVGDIGKSSISIVVKEHGARSCFLTFEGRESGTVQKIDVKPAIVIVVEQSDARTRSLDDRTFFLRAGTMMKLGQSGLFGDVRKYDGSTVHKA